MKNKKKLATEALRHGEILRKSVAQNRDVLTDSDWLKTQSKELDRSILKVFKKSKMLNSKTL